MVAVLLAASANQLYGRLISSESPQACRTNLCCPDCSTVAVSRVIDGDTFDSPIGRIRLYGVDTPENGEPCHDAATYRLRKLAGTAVRIEPGPRSQDPNGRLLYYTYTENGESIAERLITEGLGKAWTRDGQHRDLLVSLDQEAQRSRIGCLW